MFSLSLGRMGLSRLALCGAVAWGGINTAHADLIKVVDTFSVGFTSTLTGPSAGGGITQTGQGIFTGIPGATDLRQAQFNSLFAGTSAKSFGTALTPGFATMSVSGGSIGNAFLGGTFTFNLWYGNIATDDFDLSAYDQLDIRGSGAWTGSTFKVDVRANYATSGSETVSQTFSPGALGDISLDLSALTRLDEVSQLNITWTFTGQGTGNSLLYSIDEISLRGAEPSAIPEPEGPALVGIAAIALLFASRRRAGA